jgi:hypothetical protein
MLVLETLKNTLNHQKTQNNIIYTRIRAWRLHQVTPRLAPPLLRLAPAAEGTAPADPRLAPADARSKPSRGHALHLLPAEPSPGHISFLQ